MRYFQISLITIMIMPIMIFNMLDRGASPGSAKTITDGFHQAVAFCDSLALGVTFSAIIFKVIQRIIGRSLPISTIDIKKISQPFGLYAIAVGSVLAAIDRDSLSLVQAMSYIFLALVGLVTMALGRKMKSAQQGDAPEPATNAFPASPRPPVRPGDL